MWDWVKGNAEELRGIGTLVGGLGAGYGAYSQAKAMDETNKINKTLLNRQIQKEDQAQKDMQAGFSLSALSKKPDDTTLTL